MIISGWWYISRCIHTSLLSYSCNHYSRGVHYRFELFLRQAKNSKKGRYNLSQYRKEISKVWKFFLGLKNIFTLLYTTSDYYGITMVLGPIIGKFQQCPNTKTIKFHPSYIINHNKVKGFPNFWSHKLDLVYIFIPLYTIIYYQ